MNSKLNLKMNIRLICVGATFALLPSTLHAQTASPPAPLVHPAQFAAPANMAVTLRYKFTVGQVRRYAYDAETDVLMQTGQTGAGIPISMTTQTTMRQTVKSVRPADGAATIVTQIESVRALRNGQEVPMPEAQQAKMKEPFTQVMLPTGEILSLKAPALSGAGMPGMDFSKGMFGNLGSTVALPAGPVKVGDTWTSSGAAPGLGFDMASNSAFAALSPTLATITTKQTGTIDKPTTEGMPVKMQGKVSGDMSQVFDMAEGALQSMKGTMSADLLMTAGTAAGGAAPGMPSAMKMQIQVKYTMKLLTDQAVVAPNGPAAVPAQ